MGGPGGGRVMTDAEAERVIGVPTRTIREWASKKGPNYRRGLSSLIRNITEKEYREIIDRDRAKKNDPQS